VKKTFKVDILHKDYQVIKKGKWIRESSTSGLFISLDERETKRREEQIETEKPGSEDPEKGSSDDESSSFEPCRDGASSASAPI